MKGEPFTQSGFLVEGRMPPSFSSSFRVSGMVERMGILTKESIRISRRKGTELSLIHI